MTIRCFGRGLGFATAGKEGENNGKGAGISGTTGGTGGIAGNGGSIKVPGTGLEFRTLAP